jgi:hypothetical protein
MEPLNNDAFFGALASEPRYGDAASNLARTLGGLLGSAASSAAVPMLRDPEVQQAIAEATLECKTRAKEGVSEWFREPLGAGWVPEFTPKHWTILGIGALILGHWLGTTIALSIAFPRSAFKK